MTQLSQFVLNRSGAIFVWHIYAEIDPTSENKLQRVVPANDDIFSLGWA